MRLSEALLSHARWWFHLENPLDYDPIYSQPQWNGSANQRLRIYNKAKLSYAHLLNDTSLGSLSFNACMLCLLERQIVLEEESYRAGAAKLDAFEKDMLISQGD